MKDLHEMEINQYRVRTDDVKKMYGSVGDGRSGVFAMTRRGVSLMIIASDGDGWDHVSVSCMNRTPTWEEMDRVKRLFFEDDETAMQLHVPVSQHLNCHSHCLHLWRPNRQEVNFLTIPLPPSIMVAPPNSGTRSSGSGK